MPERMRHRSLNFCRKSSFNSEFYKCEAGLALCRHGYGIEGGSTDERGFSLQRDSRSLVAHDVSFSQAMM